MGNQLQSLKGRRFGVSVTLCMWVDVVMYLCGELEVGLDSKERVVEKVSLASPEGDIRL